MGILENELFKVIWTECHGDDNDFKKGYKESLKYCINKREEGWTLSDFNKDLMETKEQYKKLYGPYLDGIIEGLQFNIKQMEVLRNEYSYTS